VYILSNEDHCTKVKMPMKVLALSFFDNVELALLVESEGGERLLCTLNYAERYFEKIEPITELSILPQVWFGIVSRKNRSTKRTCAYETARILNLRSFT
jgi:hypothetical protein